MIKKLKNLKWESVALEGFPASLKDDFQGFVGLEECTDYGLDTDNKKPKKKKQQKEIKRKQTDVPVDLEVPKKKVKLSNGFIVEPCNPTSPSLNNEIAEEKINKNNISKKKKHKTEKDKKQNDKGTSNSENAKNNGANSKSNRKAKLKLGEVALDSKSNLTPEDMLTWAEFKLPEPIMRALTEMGFQRPTKIQQLTLPAAIHGRRDILGAAETGSGKTLAFGLPILSGILKLKEKASAGVNVYDLPYKKPSKKQKPVIVDSKRRKNIDKRRGRQDVKESSEDGYESGDDEKSDGDKNDDSNTVSDEELNNKQENTSDADETSDKESFIEEIEVPVKKAVNSVDEGNDSDSDNYTHLSDLLDSADDVSSDEEKADESEAADDHDKGGETVDSEHQNSDGSETDDASEEFLDENGIGCVKVIDNVELPGHVVTRTGKPLYALILTPTRELAIQISRHLIAVAKYTGIRIATIIGGMATVKQDRVLRCGPEVVVATPGRLWEMLGRHPHLQQIDTIKFLAIDETDRMVERGHFEELKTLLERINTDPEKAATRQNFVFSATLTMVHDLPIHMKGKKVTNRGKIINRKISKMTPQQKIDKFIKMFGMTEPKVVDITQQNFGTADTLTESIISCAIEHKDSYLYYILKRHPGRTIVFCNSIGSVKRLAQLFTILKCNPLPLHASMPQRQRIKNLERFRDDPHGVLVATDVAARGLDIPDVDHVVHYQVPRTAENYVHRSGRTARASKEGLTILMVEPAEAYLYTKMCRTLNKTSELPPFPIEPQVLPTLREIVSLGREIDVLMLKRRRVTQALGWREKAAKEMDMILDNDDVPCKEMDPTIDKALQVKKRRLDTLISRPVYPRGFSFKYPTLNDPLALVEKDENALEVMKNSLKSGAIKKEKRKSKNAPLLKLHKKLGNK